MLTVLFRTIFMYAIILLFMRIMGKRQLGQMQISEFITAMILSELAALPISDRTIPLAYSLVPLIIIISMEVILSFISLKSHSAQKFLESTPTVLVEKGILNQPALVQTRISMKELLVELRMAGLLSVSEAEYVYLEPNGKFSVIPKTAHRPITVSDMNLQLPEADPDVALIVDGKINPSGLSHIKKDEKWLHSAISPYTPEGVLLFACNIAGNKTLIPKEVKKKQEKQA